jgi:hypothetical protein
MPAEETQAGSAPSAADAEPWEPASGEVMARPSRFNAVVAALQLAPKVGARWRPPVVVAAALGWLLGWVLLGAVLLTATAGFLGGGPLLRPDGFVDTVRLLHLMPVATESGPISLLPMLPALGVLALMVRATRWLLGRLGAVQSPSQTATGAGLLAGGYLLVVLLIATSPTPGAEGPLLQGWAALLGLLLLGVGLPVASRLYAPRHPRTWLLVRAASTVIALLLATAFLALMLQLLLHWSDFWQTGTALLSSATQPASRLDAAALGAIQLGYLPNAVVWTASYLTGAGFSAGADTFVSPFTVTLGTLPELPLTVLIPQAPLRWPFIPLLLVGAGSLLAGAVLRNAGLTLLMRTRLVLGLALAGVSAAGMTVLAAASNGGLGPGRLASVGPAAGMVLLATAGVVGLAQVTWALFPTLVADLGPFAEQLRGWVSRVRSNRAAVRARRSGPRPRHRRRLPRRRAAATGQEADQTADSGT